MAGRLDDRPSKAATIRLLFCESLAVSTRNSGGRLENIALSPETMLSLYESMLRIRTFELAAADLFTRGLIKGAAHSYAGEEAIAAGTCANLTPRDYI